MITYFHFNFQMMNEFIFFLQIFVILGFALGALKLGKEALITWVSVLALTANLFVLKQINLFGLNVTASDAFAIGSLLGLNLLQEYFGPKEAKLATQVCFFFMFLFAFVAKLHLLYTPNAFDVTKEAFSILLEPSFRLFLASLSVFFLVQQFDIYFFNFLKQRFHSFSFATRAGISLSLSQLIDTVLFSFAGLYGVVASMTEVILLSFTIKMIVIAFNSLILRGAKNALSI